MHLSRSVVLLLAIAGPLCSYCLEQASWSQAKNPAPARHAQGNPGGKTMAFALKSAAFAEQGTIAKNFTCDGVDRSPALSWSGAPSGTHAFALIADDPDAPAGTWTHWILWNLPAQATALPEGVAKTEVLEDGARQGKNDFGRIGYGGPCPPAGKQHRYYFKLFALDAKLDLKPGANRKELEAAMKPHVLAEAQYMGTYKR
jgi:hypothetical protein